MLSEINLIKLQLEKEDLKSSQLQKYKELFSIYKRIIFLGVSLQVWQQLIGINTAMYYGPNMMKQAGFGNEEDRTSVFIHFYSFILIKCISLK